MKRGRSSRRTVAVAAFKAAVGKWAKQLRVTPRQVRVQRMTRKWGSCSRAGRLTFADALMGQPKRFQRYVAVHELLHLRVRNHGRLFKAYLAVYQSDWRVLAASRRLAPRFVA